MRIRLSNFAGVAIAAVLLLIGQLALAQQRTIRGKVVDQNGQPVVGAAVVEAGTTNGTVADIDGNFSLTLSGNSLTVSFIGYETQNLDVTGKTSVDVRLKEDNVELEDVVVVGYGQMKRSDMTGSVSSVGEASIEKAVITSVDQVLQGRAAGVQIQANTGTPGGSSTIRIRGTNSLNATSQPIFVIDGVIIDSSGDDEGNSNPLAQINPADIVSMDILKDASATAIYGSRASNGVIMITTKRGNEGHSNITYDGYVGFQQMPGKLDVMNLQEYAQHYNDIAEAGIKNASSSYVRPDLLGDGTDWQDELYHRALVTSHNLSMNGGNKDVQYAFSAGYMNQDGIARGSDFIRKTIRGNVDANIKPWLKGGVNFSLSDSKQNTASTYNIIMTALTSQPSVAVKNPDGGYDGPDDQWMPDNPVALAEITDNYNKKTNFRVNTNLEAKLYKGLTFKTELSADYNFNHYYYYQPDYEFGIKKSDTRTGTWTKTNTKYWSWRNILTYNNTLAEVHNINAMVGQEMSHNHWETQKSTATGYLSNSATDISAGNSEGALPIGYKYNSALFSYFGRVFYSFDDRYLATFTIRRDGSSQFADGNRWGWFPSAALAWRASKESFLEDNAVIDNLKLRVGWGATGNQNVEYGAYTALLSTYPTSWGNGILNANNANPGLKWETTYSTNVGVDVSVLNGAIDLIADVYYKKTKDLLLKIDLPAFLGSGGGSGYGVASNPWGNIGSLENKGIEITLNTHNITKPDFQWSSNVVFSLNRNKVKSLDTATGTLPKTLQIGSETATVTNTVVGQPVAQFWGWKVIGRFDDPSDFYYKDANGNIKQVAIPEGSSISQSGTWIGDYIFEDINGDGVINNDDATFIGNPEPKFTWGFGNTFSYKGFDLSVQFSGSYGNDVLNYNRRTLEVSGSTSNLLTSVLNYAKVEKIDANGPDDFRNYRVTNASSTSQPRLYTESGLNKNNRVSDAFVEDGSYIRLQNISLSYTFPRKWIEKAFMTNLKVYVNLQNVYTWTEYSGYDPEVGSLWGNALMNGIDYGRYPSPRMYTLGLTMTF